MNSEIENLKAHITLLERKLASQQVMAAAARLSSDLILLLNPRQLRFVEVNQTAASRLGYPGSELLAMDIISFFPDITADDWRDICEHAVRSSETDVIRTQMQARGGERFSTEVQLHRMRCHAGNFILLVVHDHSRLESSRATVNHSHIRLQSVLEGNLQAILLLAADGAVLVYNHVANVMFQSLFNIRLKEGDSLADAEAGHLPSSFGYHFKAACAGRIIHAEERFKERHGDVHWFIIDFVPVMENQQVREVAINITDMTERKVMEQTLRNQALQLEAANLTLERKHTALKEIMENIRSERKRTGRQITTNIDKVVLPQLELLRQGLPEALRDIIDEVEKNLKEITSPFMDKLVRKFNHLTPAEIRICNHIRRGLTAKEIARLENLSVGTIHVHRRNIRRKLRITNSKINLVSCLEATASADDTCLIHNDEFQNK